MSLHSQGVVAVRRVHVVSSFGVPSRPVAGRSFRGSTRASGFLGRLLRRVEGRLGGLARRRRAGLPAHMSALGWAHILFTGEYRWRKRP